MFELGNPSAVLLNGTHFGTKFETAVGFTYTPTISYILGDIAYTTASGPVSFGRYLNPNVNAGESILWFPPGSFTSMVYLRIRSGGGGDWWITPVNAQKVELAIPQVIPGTPTDPYPIFLCTDGNNVEMAGIKFHVDPSPTVTPNAEPQIFEICVPQDPESCLVQPD